MPYSPLFRTVLGISLLLILPALSHAQPVRGVAGDLWADVVLGQGDYGIPNSAFGQTKFNEATAGSLFNPASATVDPQHGILYVFDAGNNRVLGLPVSQFSSNPASNQPGFNATVVLGQPDFQHAGCNHDSNWQTYPAPVPASSTCLCGLRYDLESLAEVWVGGNMAVDGQGDLYVPDFFNNRVLRYNWSDISAFQTGTAVTAAGVWGQDDFTSVQNNQGNSAPSASSLQFYPVSDWRAGVGTDKWGNLWVADNGNNRVLRFPNPSAPNPGLPAATADVVLGQTSFTGNATTSMYSPIAVRVDQAGDVYVTALPNGSAASREVMIFKPTSYAASGQPVYGTGMVASPNVTIPAGAGSPLGLEWDAPSTGGSLGIGGAPAAGTTGGLWVSYLDGYSGYIVLYKVTLGAGNPPASITATAVKSLMSDNLTGPASGGTTGDQAPYLFSDLTGDSANSWNVGDIDGSVGVDNLGNVFVVGGFVGGSQDAWRFPAPIPAPHAGTAHSADVDVMKPYRYQLQNAPGYHGMDYAAGVAIATYNGVTQVVESDSLIRFWAMPSGGPAAFQNGPPVDGLIGGSPQSPLTGGGFGRVKADKAGHLWAIAPGGTQLWVYKLPLINGESASQTLSLGSPIPLLGGGSVSLTNSSSFPGHVEGLAVAPDASYLWFTDAYASRVMRIRNPLTYPVVDIVLGQPNSTSTTTDYPSGTPSQTNLNNPGSAVLDQYGNLFVGDHSLEFNGDGRLLRYDAPSIQNNSTTAHFNVPASAVYGVGGTHNFTSAGDANPQNASIANPWEPAISPGDGVLVAGSDAQTYPYNNMLVVLANPLVSDDPVTHLNDFDLQSYSAVFDDAGNLYVANHNRSRVFVYLKPFEAAYPTPTLTPSNIQSCCQTVWDDPQGNAILNNSTYGLAYNPAGPGTLYVGGGTSIVSINPATGASLGTMPVAAGTFNGVMAMAMGVSLPQYLYAGDQSSVHKILASNGSSPTSFLIGSTIMAIGVDGADNDDLYVGAISNSVYKVTQGGTMTALTLSGSPSIVGLGGVVLEGGGSAPLTLYVTDIGSGDALQFVQASTGAVGSTTFNFTATEQAGNLEFPHQMARDTEGNIYLAQTGRYFLFDPSFNYIATCLTSPVVPDAQGIVVDPQGGVYVGSSGDNHALLKLGCPTSASPPTSTPTPTITPTPTLTPIPTPTPVVVPLACSPASTWADSVPEGIALDASNNLYVVDGSSRQIDVFNPGGSPGPGVGAGKMNSPEDVAVDGNGYLYVTDQDLDQVFLFNSNGAPLTQWGSIGSAPGQFISPYGIAVTSTSAGTTVFVVDQGNQRVQEFLVQFSPSLAISSPVAPWGTGGTGGHGTFSSPAGAALDASGNVYVADMDTGLVQVFNGQGTWQNQWDATSATALLTANFLSVYHQCLVYVTDGFGAVGVFDTNGNVLGSVPGPGPGNNFYDTEGVAVGSGGWFVADQGMGQIYGFGQCPVTSCWTPVSTPTPTSTCTLTPTASPSFTATPSTTLTPTPTPTNSITDTPTLTASWTATPSATYSPTSTASGTPTLSPTGTPPTATDTPTSTPSSSMTATPSLTATGTPTPTATFTATSTESLTPTSSVSPTASPTSTPTASTTPSWTSTATRTLTPTLTPTATARATATPTSAAQVVLYPNPVNGNGPVLIAVPLTVPGDVKVKVFTTAFRKVQDKTYPDQPVGVPVSLALTDREGTPLASGLYYVVVTWPQGRAIGKLLILR